MAADARTIAVRGPDGRLAFVRSPKDSYAAQSWLQRDGDARALKDVARAGHCDGLGCVLTVAGVAIAAPLRPEALAEDCRRAVLIISAVPASGCKGPSLVLDAKATAQAGGYAIMLTSDINAAGVNPWRGKRPWVLNSGE